MVRALLRFLIAMNALESKRHDKSGNACGRAGLTYAGEIGGGPVGCRVLGGGDLGKVRMKGCISTRSGLYQYGQDRSSVIVADWASQTKRNIPRGRGRARATGGAPAYASNTEINFIF